MIWKDEIVEEVRKARDSYFAQFDYDLERVFADLKEKERQHPERMVTLKPRKPRKQELRSAPDRRRPVAR